MASKEELMEHVLTLTNVLDRALKLCPKYVPAEHRNPTPGGGNVHTTATAILVAARALLAGFIEEEAAASAPAKG